MDSLQYERNIQGYSMGDPGTSVQLTLKQSCCQLLHHHRGSHRESPARVIGQFHTGCPKGDMCVSKCVNHCFKI